MQIRWSDLWRWDGTVNRDTYLALGIVLFLVKFLLDLAVAQLIFDRTWSMYNYLLMPGEGLRISLDGGTDAWFGGTLLALALPFIWAGIALTLRRLRAVGLPAWFLPLFFVPFVNMVFFVVLGFTRRRAIDRPVKIQPIQVLSPIPSERVFMSLGAHDWIAACVSALVSASLALGVTYLSIHVFTVSGYGLTLFVGVPFALGLFSSLIFGVFRARGVASCIGIACLSTMVYAIGLIAMAFDGAICILMATPIGVTLAIMGGLFGYVVQRSGWSLCDARDVSIGLFMLMPLLLAAEQTSSRQPSGIAVRTAVEIEASPHRVWQRVIEFPELPEPDELIFRVGISYPTQALIQGRGQGAIRHCVFSTGTFVEPIEIWDEPRLLRFAVVAQPAPMVEWTPYSTIHAPHLESILVCTRGEFLLVPLTGDRTQLIGTTWYSNKMWPAWYWRLWSDFIIHQIHLRVLNHIKYLCE